MPSSSRPQDDTAAAATGGVSRFMQLADRAAFRLEAVISCVLLLGLVLAGLLPILFRGSERVNTSWVEPFTHHVVLWIALFGALIATRDQKHITIDAVGQLLPPRWKVAVRTGTDVLSTVICAIVTALAIRFVRSDWEFATSKIFWNLPENILQLALPIGFALLAIRFLLNAIKNGLEAKRLFARGGSSVEDTPA